MMTRPSSRPSVTRLITRRLILVAGLLMVAQVILVAMHYGLDGEQLGVRVAEREAERIADHIVAGPAGTLVLTLSEEHVERYRHHSTAYAFRVIDADGAEIAGMNQALFTAPLPDPAKAPDLFWRIVPTANGETRVLVQRFDRIGSGFLVAIAIAADPDRLTWAALLHEVFDHVAVPMVPLALLLLTVNVYEVRRGLHPLARAAREAAVLDARRGGMRLSIGDDFPREVHALVGAVNAALGRADEVLRFQREFTANVAHELRTPLAVLLLQLDEIGGQAAAEAKREIQAMARLVDQLLRVAQIEGMSAEPSAEVDLAEVAREIVQQLAPLALDRGRETEFLDEGAAVIQGHRDAIAGAVRNLVDNALRAAPKGSVVTVSAGPGPVIEVRDQGPGIDPALRRDLFSRFAQGDRRTRGSTGLGLAIVAKTMEIHDGSVTVSDCPGGGTRFRLTFPDPLAPDPMAPETFTG
jgi:signal transduction histidine kinase